MSLDDEDGEGQPGAQQCATCQVLTENLRALSDHYADKAGQRRSVNAWTQAFNLDPKILQRAAGPRGLTIDSLEKVALALGLQPWQLLVPGFDPATLPHLIPGDRSPYAIALANGLDAITDPVFQDSAYAMCVRVLDRAREDAESMGRGRPPPGSD
jgi:hypothetical protein